MSLVRYVDAPMAVAVLVAGTLLAVVLAGRARRRGTPSGPVVARTALATVVGVSLLLALTGGRAGRRSVNLVPLRTVVDQAHNPDLGLLVVNLAGNVVCFAPLGALLVVLRRGALVATVAGTAFSAAIEVTQYGLGRTADVDDVLLNGIGVALGALLVASRGAARRRGRWATATRSVVAPGGEGHTTGSPCGCGPDGGACPRRAGPDDRARG